MIPRKGRHVDAGGPFDFNGPYLKISLDLSC